MKTKEQIIEKLNQLGITFTIGKTNIFTITEMFHQQLIQLTRFVDNSVNLLLRLKNGKLIINMNATEKKLIKQAKEKGFKIGVEFYSTYSLQICTAKNGIFEYAKDKNYEILYLDDNAVFCNGIWSQII